MDETEYHEKSICMNKTSTVQESIIASKKKWIPKGPTSKFCMVDIYDSRRCSLNIVGKVFTWMNHLPCRKHVHLEEIFALKVLNFYLL